MKTNFKVGIGCLSALVLCGIGYNVYSKQLHEESDRLACSTVNLKSAVTAVENDLLQMPTAEFFGKSKITIGSLYVHRDSVGIDGSKIVVPFTITGRNTANFSGLVKCSDMRSIEYAKNI